MKKREGATFAVPSRFFFLQSKQNRSSVPLPLRAGFPFQKQPHHLRSDQQPRRRRHKRDAADRPLPFAEPAARGHEGSGGRIDCPHTRHVQPLQFPPHDARERTAARLFDVVRAGSRRQGGCLPPIQETADTPARRACASRATLSVTESMQSAMQAKAERSTGPSPAR